jgi:hypothetical protein
MENDDYIDNVVLVKKPDSAETAHDFAVAGRRKASVVNDVRLTRVGKIEISSLAIDDGMDGGGDPYNSTGKHCVVKIKE